MTWRRRLVTEFLTRIEQPMLAGATDPRRVRARFERGTGWGFPAPRGYRGLTRRMTPQGLWLGAATPPRRILVWFHGGAFVMGSPRTHAKPIAGLAMAAGISAFLPRYPLLPESPFPAAYESARAAWDMLVTAGWPAHRIVLGGDSAGGNLALGLLAGLLDQGVRPAGIVLFSPWADLTLSGASLARNAATELLLPPGRIPEIRDMYLGGVDPADPRASPGLAAFPGAPPAFIAVAPGEMLYDDALLVGRNLALGGATVNWDCQPGLPHAWPLLRGILPEATASIDRAAGFVVRAFDQVADNTR